MPSKDEFRSVQYPGVTYKPRGDGGTLVLYDNTCVRIYVNGPEELPWAAEKSKEAPQWKRTRGASALDFPQMRRIVERYARGGVYRLSCLQEHTTVRARAYAAFMQHIDPLHLDELSRVRLRAFNYYCSLRRVPGLFDLSTSGTRTEELAGGTALAFALSNFGFLSPRRYARPLDAVRRLVRRKRRDMVVALGFPAQTANLAVRALERLRPFDVDVGTIRLLRDLFVANNRLALKRVAHLDALRSGIIELLLHPGTRDVLSMGLLEEIAHPHTVVGGLVDIPSTLQDTVRMLRARGAHVPMFRSVNDVCRIHDAEVRQMLRGARTHTHQGQFPDAPVPPVPGEIEYLATAGALEEESHAMRNCVRIYDDRVVSFECFLYRVLSPERCTLAIDLGPDLNFRIREIKAHANSPAARATVAHVDNWLRTHQSETANQRIAQLSSAARGHAWGAAPPADLDLYDIPF